MTNIAGSLTALSLLSYGNAFTSLGSSSATYESRQVRTARSQFTAPVITPPWKTARTNTPVSQQVAAIKRLNNIIEQNIISTDPAQRDIQTSFTTFKALDQLRLLAEAAAAPTISTAERLQLNGLFAKGLNDLQAYLAKAPSDKVAIAFATSTRRAESVGAQSSTTGKFTGAGLVEARTDALPGLSGNEVFRIDLSKSTGSDSVSINLADGPQPPTLDSVTDAINAAIAGVPQRDVNGNIVYDSNGDTLPRYTARFAVTKSTGKWGFELSAANDTERVSLDQVGAPDALFVAGGFAGTGTAATTQFYRFDDPAAALNRTTLSSLSARNANATATAALIAPKSSIAGVTLAPSTVRADTIAAATISDGKGNSYVVGTTAGDIGSNLGSGRDDLFLAKLDDAGNIIWQRTLGSAGTAKGAALSFAPDGSIVVAGTVSGSFDGASSDGDLLVAKYDRNGDEKFASVIHGAGGDTASAIAVGADGHIYVGGRAATGNGDAFIARLDATGKLAERRSIDSVGSDDNLLAVLNQDGAASVRSIAANALGTDLGSISLGNVDARAIAVAADGQIAVGGAVTTAGNRDGFVARIDAGLSGASFTSIATSADDQVDSLAFLGADLYAGGRTAGILGDARTGSVDGFVTRIHAATGTITDTRQFGRSDTIAAPVLVTADTGGNNLLSGLGLRRGTLSAGGSDNLIAQTSLRAGDNFQIRIGTGALKKITITADDTLQTLAARINKAIGSKTAVTTPLSSGIRKLQFTASESAPIELVAGPGSQDALAKLGIEPARLIAPKIAAPKAPRVQPGGTFSLDLTQALDLTSTAGAKVAAARIKAAISTTQSAYRSLYWDAGKATLVNGYAGNATALNTAQSAQLAGYQEALARLTATAQSYANTTGY
jgi:hypothetical protein